MANPNAMGRPTLADEIENDLGVRPSPSQHEALKRVCKALHTHDRVWRLGDNKVVVVTGTYRNTGNETSIEVDRRGNRRRL